MKKTWFFLTALNFIFFQQAYSQPAEKALNHVDRNYYIENKGQWHSDVLYLARMGSLDAWITKYGVNYTFYKMEEVFNPYAKEHHPDKFAHKDYNIIGHRVLLELQNHNPAPAREGRQQQEGYYNYFIGNDETKHATYVGLYKEAFVKNVYEGIDIRYYFDKGSLRYDYVVHAGADPSQIRFTLAGSEKTYINHKGNLVFVTRFGEVAMADLYVYQEKDKKPVSASFVKQDNNTYAFSIENYDRTQDLIIDPLVYSTYIGGNSADYGESIAVDGSGNAYITGTTSSPDYDKTTGAFQTVLSGTLNAFVTKLNATGTSLVYSTYIGGNAEDLAYGISLNSSGNAYITGYTSSTNYDVTAGAFQIGFGGGSYDVFVTQLNTTGTGLVYSTYIGGSNTDYAYSIATDAAGNAYITGYTNSTNYDITTGAFQTTKEAGNDIFVTKLNATGTALVYSTYIGGNDNDYAYGIAVDATNNAYIIGYTHSTNYDVTVGVFQNYNAGITDAVVTKLNTTGTTLVYSTYIGGTNFDYGQAITVNSTGNAYITGRTHSMDYHVTTGAFQETHGGGTMDVFVTQFNPSGTGLVYSTFIGGVGNEYSRGIVVDATGYACIAGETTSNDFDTTIDGFQTTFGGGTYDAFTTKLNETGATLEYSTYIGGSGNDYCHAVALDGTGNAYITGYTFSTDFDVTAGAFQTTNGGSIDVFVTKFYFMPVGIGNSSTMPLLNFELYPNPNSGSFILQSQNSKNVAFDLMDITGKVLNTYNMQGTNRMDIQVQLPAGMYYIRERKSGAVQKIVITE